MARFVCSTLLLIAINCVFHTYGHTTISDNGYDGIVVAIHAHVSELPDLIDKIKNTFTDASAFLYTATNNRVYFRNITILVPTEWSEDLGYVMSTSETYETANVRVDKGAGTDNRPYTHQVGLCGEFGQYIRLTDKFFTDASVPTNLGPLGKVIVHEWGHLRWGLFDEYTVDEDESHFYFDANGELRPVACHPRITGSNPCEDRGADELPLPDCVFHPNHAQPDDLPIKSSIMFAQWIDAVEEFCHDDPSDEYSYHNRMAPNRQNRICSGQSVWGVMLNHTDFKDGNNPTRFIDDTTPNFIIKRSGVRRVVLVLDTSGSMDGDRIQRLHQSATYFIETRIEDGSFVGIVGFSSYAVIHSGITEIKYGFQRGEIASNVPQVASGATSIGDGLRVALQVLQDGNVTSEGASLLLITDGIENTYPFLMNVMQEVYDSGVRVDTIAYTEAAQSTLQELSDNTGGLYFYVPDNDTSTAFIDSLAATISENPLGNSDIIPITLESSVISLTRSEMTYEDILFLDSSLGNRTIFSFLFSDTVFDVALLSPTGGWIDKYYKGYAVNVEQRRVAIEIQGTAKAGMWKYIIYNSNGTADNVKIILESRVKYEDDEPIRVLGRLSKTTLNYDVDPQLVVRAEVKKGYSPVIGAHVIATIDTPSGQVVLTLLDNGAGGDVIKNDGVYSAYFLDFSSCSTTCRYGVKINVRNTAGTAMIKSYETLSATLPMNPDLQGIHTTTVPADLFTRSSSGGAFDVDGGPPPGTDPKDIYPPSRISDLKIEEQSYDNGTIKLTWTAVGDDYDRGIVHEYDLRMSTDVDELYDNIEKATRATNEDLIVGNLSSPQISGSSEMVVVGINKTLSNGTRAFSIRAIDSDGNQGKPSNVAFTTLVYVPQETTTTNNIDDTRVLLIVALVTSTVLGLIVLSLIIIFVTKYKYKNKDKIKPFE